jgi:hypothetical protein
MATLGMGFVHAMLVDFSDGSDRGPTWDRERRLTDTLVDTTTRFDDLYEPQSFDEEHTPPPEPPIGGLRASLDWLLALPRRTGLSGRPETSGRI